MIPTSPIKPNIIRQTIAAALLAAGTLLSAGAHTIDEARHLAEDGNIDDALELLRKLEADNPKDASIPLLMGEYYIAIGEDDNARDAYQLAREKGSRDALLGLAAMEADRYDIAAARELIEQYRKTLKKGKRVIAEDESEAVVDKIDRIDNALARVEMIEVVDSLVVDADDFFRHYRLSPEAGSVNSTDVLPQEFAAADPTVVYEPESGREMMWAAPGEGGAFELFSSSALYGDTWETPTPLGADLGGGGDANYPFLMPDGITLYYAADGEDSLGGLDIYISRRDDDGGFLQPQNLGMPYNSPYNDYLLAIDEFTGVGWWASDRNRIPGKVTIYIFIPQELRKNVDPDSPELAARARLNAISATWNPSTDRNALLQRIAAIDTDRTSSGKQFELYLPGRGLVSNYSDLHSEEARQAMRKLVIEQAKAAELTKRLQTLRDRYAAGNRDVASEIMELEQQAAQNRGNLTELRNRVVTLEGADE